MDAPAEVSGLPTRVDQPEPPDVVIRVLRAWHQTECGIAVAALVFIAFVLVLDVIGRELLFPLAKRLGAGHGGPTGVYGAQKMAVFALAIATYAGVGVAAATATHLVPRVAFGVVPLAWSGTMDRIADLVTGSFLLGVAWYGFGLVTGSFATGLRAPVLQWPVWPFQAAIPLGFASAALRYYCFARWPGLRPVRPAAQE
jgi:hypothetical protein